jgi:hypothetical protein
LPGKSQVLECASLLVRFVPGFAVRQLVVAKPLGEDPDLAGLVRF